MGSLMQLGMTSGGDGATAFPSCCHHLGTDFWVSGQVYVYGALHMVMSRVVTEGFDSPTRIFHVAGLKVSTIGVT